MRNASSPLNQFILLGLICQGFSWDNIVLPTLNAILWLVCLKLPRRPFPIHQVVESSLIVVGTLAGYILSKSFGQSAHFSIGHGLTLLQLARLMRPLNTREKAFSTVAAFVHLGVACTIVLDYRFIVILFVAIVLIPRVLMELASDEFIEAPAAARLRPGMGFQAYAVIFIAMVVFFATFPRGLLGTNLPRALAGSNEGSLLDSVLDPARSALRNSSQIIMQVEAKSLNYLKANVLVDFDGEKWRTERNTSWQRIYIMPEEYLKDYDYRRVRVKNVAYLGRGLPIDGHIVNLRGKFFRRAFQTTHGTIETEAMWNTSNNIYEYWIEPDPAPARLPVQSESLLRHPRPSPRLKTWLDETLAGRTNGFDQAKFLEAYFHQNFEYKLGAPELNRVNQLDEFIFEQREGHCERYASALTLLLRMKGIPARVVIGFAPNSRNYLSGWFDIRFSDAHAWTEAWFEELGWVTLDATPISTTPRPNYYLLDLLEALDVMWYLNIVNLDSAAQGEMLNTTVKAGGAALTWIGDHSGAFGIVGLVVIFAIAVRYYRPRLGGDTSPMTARKRAQILAEHYYGQMLRSLASQGIHRASHKTPFEFLAELERHPPAAMEDIRMVTQTFCATRYGNAPLTGESKSAIESALQRIRHAASGEGQR